MLFFFIDIDTGGERGNESEWIYAGNTTLATNYVTDCSVFSVVSFLEKSSPEVQVHGRRHCGRILCPLHLVYSLQIVLLVLEHW